MSGKTVLTTMSRLSLAFINHNLKRRRTVERTDFYLKTFFLLLPGGNELMVDFRRCVFSCNNDICR